MTAFGISRKARVIHTLDDESEEPKQNLPVPLQAQTPIKFGRSKPAKSSSLRKSINFNDDERSGDDRGPATATAGSPTTAKVDEEEADGPVVIRPLISRTGLVGPKRRPSSSRLSFAAGDDGAGDGDNSETFTPKTLGRRTLETKAVQRSSSAHNLLQSARFAGGDDDETRPRYSKAYLEELQSSTLSTPQNLAELRIVDDQYDFGTGDGIVGRRNEDDAGSNAMDVDSTELEGAVVVPGQDLVMRRSPRPVAARILTETEINERKERRARLALEADVIPLDTSDADEDDDDRGVVRSVTFQSKVKAKKKASESRLIAEDEDLGEGYDEFVADGGLALGAKAEREAARRQRNEMAELIAAAAAGEEGGGSDNSSNDSSEAERRAAYDAAQWRAGLDGLRRPAEEDLLDGAGGGRGGANVAPRMQPLPDLAEVLQRMHNLVHGLEDDVAQKRRRIAEMEREKADIFGREKEVQEILDQAGAKYRAIIGANAGAGSMAQPVSQSPLRLLLPGMTGDHVVERGLESLGRAPTQRPGRV